MFSIDDIATACDGLLTTHPLLSHKHKCLSLYFDDDPPRSPSTSGTHLSTPSASANSECGGSDPQDSKGFLLMDIPKTVKKTKEESTLLPDPILLPMNFRPDVHLSVTSKRMTKTSR